MAKTILEEWEFFEAEVMPADAPQVQRNEMRKAFFAGNFNMFQNFVTASFKDGDNDERMEKTLLAWEVELTQWAKDAGEASVN